MATTNPIQLSGKKIGYLEVISPCKKPSDTKHKGRYWLCRCDCGITKPIPQVTLTKKDAYPSCGCHQFDNVSTRGGITAKYRREYIAWHNMLGRCGINRKGHERYEGRGITVCSDWVGENGFENFMQHIGVAPSADHEIDRINNDGNYEPGNVKWATHPEQMRNTSRNVFLTHNNKTMCVADWAIHLGISRKTLDKRLVMGWSIERALSSSVSTTHAKNSSKRSKT
jgi:hypothetical protein